MLVMAMKEQYLELKKLLQVKLSQTNDEKQKQDLEQRLKRVDWAIAEMDRKKVEMQEVEL